MSLYEASDMDQSLTLTEDTLAAFDLPQQPFGPVEPGHISFSDETTTDQVADAKQALMTGDDLLLILGDEGAGKTVMLKQLNELTGVRIQCFTVQGSERFSTMNLFAGLLEAFKHSPPEKLQDILNDLIPYLQSMVGRNTLSVVVLDDAHKVKESELTQLLSAMLYINSHDETFMRIAMAAPEEFEARIPELLPEGADLPYSSLAITRMTSTRAADFIEYRMQQAGLQGDSPFSVMDVNELVEKSDGLPGFLQVAAVESLNKQFGPSKHTSSGAAVASGSSILQSRASKMALGVLAVFCIALGILMFLPGKSNEDAGRYTTSTTSAVTLSDSTPELNIIENSVSTEAVQSGTTTSDTTNRLVLDITESREQAANQLELTEAGVELSPGSESAVASSQNDLVAPDISNPDNSVNKPKPIVIVASPEPTANSTPEPAPLSEVAEARVTPEPDVAAAALEPPEPPKNELTSNAQVGPLESSSWILLQNKSGYTVQMSASRDRESVVNFLNKHSDALPAPNSIYTFVRNGSNWYALLHGLYESTDAARVAVEAMPAEALTNQPWIRSVARVQEILKSQ